jgi:hypothetical protein
VGGCVRRPTTRAAHCRRPTVRPRDGRRSVTRWTSPNLRTGPKSAARPRNLSPNTSPAQ